MSREQLDEMLDASAPVDRTIDARDVRAMVNAARFEGSPRRRRRRTAVLTGALAMLLIGGAGIATATSEWSWSDGLENPDRSYTGSPTSTPGLRTSRPG